MLRQEITVSTRWGGQCPIVLINSKPEAINVCVVIAQDKSPHSVLPTYTIPNVAIDAWSNVLMTISMNVELDYDETTVPLFNWISYAETSIFLYVYNTHNNSVRLCESNILVNIVIIAGGNNIYILNLLTSLTVFVVAVFIGIICSKNFYRKNIVTE